MTTAIVTLTDLAPRINQEHRKCEAAMRGGLEHALEAGRLLLEAKTLCTHGTWEPWLEAHFDGAPRTARAYMRVARELPKLNGKRQHVADLTFRGAIAAVASNSQKIRTIPEDEQDEALAAWARHNCKNAHQAVCRAQSDRFTCPVTPAATRKSAPEPEPEAVDQEREERLLELEEQAKSLPESQLRANEIARLYDELEELQARYCEVQDEIQDLETAQREEIREWCESQLSK